MISDIPAGDRKIANLFYSVRGKIEVFEIFFWAIDAFWTQLILTARFFFLEISYLKKCPDRNPKVHNRELANEKKLRGKSFCKALIVIIKLLNALPDVGGADVDPHHHDDEDYVEKSGCLQKHEI